MIIHERHAASSPQGGIVRGTIDLAKFIAALMFLGAIGTCVTCVYVCGSAATTKSRPTEKAEPSAPGSQPSTGEFTFEPQSSGSDERQLEDKVMHSVKERCADFKNLGGANGMQARYDLIDHSIEVEARLVSRPRREDYVRYIVQQDPTDRTHWTIIATNHASAVACMLAASRTPFDL